MKQALFNHLKNMYGWKTKRKIVVIAVDDYGNVRLDSKKAREKMDSAGLKAHSHFDAYDTLETRDDLEALYEVLSSVKDKNKRHAVFTPFALPCNINFEAMAGNNYKAYEYELLPETYNKLSAKDPKAYEGTWELWKKGIKEGFMKPQFHGREHFNLKVFNEKLQQHDHEVLTALKNRSYTSLSSTGYPTIGYTAAFEFWDFKENYNFKYIIEDGLRNFKKVYGYDSIYFNPPGGREHTFIHKYLKDCGIKYLDTPLIKKEHQNKGKFKTKINYTGKVNELGMLYQVRNVVFEPKNKPNFNWVDYSFQQVNAAFKLSRPAIISSHRVNFCGHIDEKNRADSLKKLLELLKKITSKWPDVEFMTSDELSDEMSKHKN